MFSGKRLKKKSSPGFKKKFETYLQELSDVKWSIEVVKSIVTGFIILIISTFSLGFIAHISPGEYSDNRLKEYLLKTISQEIGIEYWDDRINISRTLNGISNGINVEDTIVLCGSYTTESQYVPGEYIVGGCYICIFERAPRTFFNDLFRTKPRYVPTFLRVTDAFGDEFLCTACESVDVDSDGVLEIRIEYLANFADRGTRLVVVIEQEDSRWKIVAPDLSGVKADASQIANREVWPCIESFTFSNPQNPTAEKDVVYGLYNNGYIRTVSNPLTGGVNWLYRIAVPIEDDENRYFYSAYVMIRLTGNEMIQEEDWNAGSVYFPEHEDRKVEEIVEDLWGWSFYKEYNVPWTN